jgi:ferrochelatase
MSFGGPEKNEDVMPFLENVLRGRNVPRERMLEVAEHYYHFGGKSPINDQNLALIDALGGELKSAGLNLPIYFGNRNWHPLITDTVRQMREDGCKRTIAFFTSGMSCYSGCRQYRENIQSACEAVGEGAPIIEKTRMYFNHPSFIEAVCAQVQQSLDKLSEEERGKAHILFTAHSIPESMAKNSRYELHFREASKLVSQALGGISHDCVYQSRSGPPQVPWLEPDVCDHIKTLHDKGHTSLVIVPIGFMSDHMEVLYDLDTEARDLCAELGIRMERARTPSTHPAFIRMVRELIEERVRFLETRPYLGDFGPSHDVCPANCCLPGERPKPLAV